MTILIMECIISSKYLFINFLIKYMEICQNSKEFHLIRQISKSFSTVIDPNFMHMNHDFNIIGNITDIKRIFELWDLTDYPRKLSLYKNIKATKYYISSFLYAQIYIPKNYIHILDYKPKNLTNYWGSNIWNIIHETYISYIYAQQINYYEELLNNMINLCRNCKHLTNNIVKEVEPINVRSIYREKLRYATNHDLDIRKKSNKPKYVKHDINFRVPKCSKRPKTIKYHR
jgi:hypothetical protein